MPVKCLSLAQRPLRFYPVSTSEAPDNHELARQVAVLEERTDRRQAEYRTDIARLAEDMAKRDRDNLRWQLTLWLAAVVVLGLLIRWPF